MRTVQRRVRAGSGWVMRRGRPAERACQAERQEVIARLKEDGLDQSIASLQDQFPRLARREVADLVQRARAVAQARGRVQHYLSGTPRARRGLRTTASP